MQHFCKAARTSNLLQSKRAQAQQRQLHVHGIQYACIQACRGRSDLQLEGRICISMHAENLRCICGRQALYVADAALQISFSWGWCIAPISSEAEPRQQYWWAVAPLQQLGQQHSVIVICDSAAIVDLACHVLQRLPWNSILKGQTGSNTQS